MAVFFVVFRLFLNIIGLWAGGYWAKSTNSSYYKMSAVGAKHKKYE